MATPFYEVFELFKRNEPDAFQKLWDLCMKVQVGVLETLPVERDALVLAAFLEFQRDSVSCSYEGQAIYLFAQKLRWRCATELQTRPALVSADDGHEGTNERNLHADPYDIEKGILAFNEDLAAWGGLVGAVETVLGPKHRRIMRAKILSYWDDPVAGRHDAAADVRERADVQTLPVTEGIDKLKEHFLLKGRADVLDLIEKIHPPQRGKNWRESELRKERGK